MKSFDIIIHSDDDDDFVLFELILKFFIFRLSTESQQHRIFAQTATSSSSSGCIPSGLFVNEGKENQI